LKELAIDFKRPSMLKSPSVVSCHCPKRVVDFSVTDDLLDDLLKGSITARVCIRNRWCFLRVAHFGSSLVTKMFFPARRESSLEGSDVWSQSSSGPKAGCGCDT
jgi:hypothetical protein